MFRLTERVYPTLRYWPGLPSPTLGQHVLLELFKTIKIFIFLTGFSWGHVSLFYTFWILCWAIINRYIFYVSVILIVRNITCSRLFSSQVKKEGSDISCFAGCKLIWSSSLDVHPWTGAELLPSGPVVNKQSELELLGSRVLVGDGGTKSDGPTMPCG